MKGRHALIILSVILLSITTGCWDRQEIEQLGIVAGVAIDCRENSGNTEDKGGTGYEEGGNDLIMLTQQYVVPKALGGGEKGGGTQTPPYSNSALEGTSIYRIIQSFKDKDSRIPNYEHMKVIVISSETARSFNLYKLLNAFLRHREITRSTNVVISQEKAYRILEIKPVTEDLPAFMLNMLTNNKNRTADMPPTTTLGDISKNMAGGTSFGVQRVMVYGDEVKVSGLAVIKGDTYKLAGWLDEYETEGYNCLIGKAAGMTAEVKDNETGEIIIYEADRSSSTIKPQVSDNKISFTVDIKSEGSVAEDWIMTSDAFEKGFLERVGMLAEKEVENKVKKALEKMQTQLKADIVGFGKKLEIKYPKLWNQVKDNWDEHFSRADIEINVKINVREFGRQGSKK